jgi:SAM-dependent methyltransferase
VGCGFMQGTIELLKHHKRVYAVDTELQRQRIRDALEACSGHPRFAGFKTSEDFAGSRLRLGAAYCVNVLHTLPSRRIRTNLLRSVHRNLRDSGILILDVPAYEHYYAKKMTPQNRHGDGYIFKRGSKISTFYRFTTEGELDRWANTAGFEFEQKHVDHHHLVRRYRRVS